MQRFGTSKLPNIRNKDPLWAGPCGEGPNGGITYSLINRYLGDRERFRLHAMEGWRIADKFNHRLEYGNFWHICEEHYAPDKVEGRKTLASLTWQEKLAEYANALAEKYPMQREEIQHWYAVCQVQWPEYCEFYRRRKEAYSIEPLFREKVFDVPYRLLSGRIVRLRGKWDGVDLITQGKRSLLYLYENKTKGDIQESLVERQLTFDCQTMLYICALWEEQNSGSMSSLENVPICGVRYNVIRRPLSGGRHTITRHKGRGKNPIPETEEAYYERLRGLIASDPEYFFMRWVVLVSPSERRSFLEQCLNPILENICDDYEWWNRCYRLRGDVYDDISRQKEFKHHYPRHYRTPYGLYAPLLEGNATDMDSYLDTGSTVGLVRATTLFPELQG